jgi:hypothetical protein
MALLLWGVFFVSTAFGQRVLYSEPEKDDNRRLNFEIIGKVEGNILIYKSNRSRNWISVLDEDMQSLGNEELGYIPSTERNIQVDFVTYPDYAWMIYQYQRRNVVYCMAAKLDGRGKRLGELIQLDTTHLNFATDNKLYSVAASEDRKKIMVHKINSRNRELFKMTVLLFNQKMDLLHKKLIDIPMQSRSEELGDWVVDNEGGMLMVKYSRNYNDNIGEASILLLGAGEAALQDQQLSLKDTWLDNIRIKADNVNKRYLLSSFYSNDKRGGVDGYYIKIVDRNNILPVAENKIEFSEELRQEAKGNATTKTAFNDYFIRQIILRKDGGFIIGSEAYYTTSRANNWNRWDYLYGTPYMGFNNYYYTPYYSRMWPGWGTRPTPAIRYHADNILLQSYSSTVALEWSNVITKSQYDDETDVLLSFQLMNTGAALHVLYNLQERRDKLINDLTVQPGGEMGRNPGLKNMDKGHDFMPALSKQISSRQLIIPTIYRSYICFAKVEYN